MDLGERDSLEAGQAANAATSGGTLAFLPTPPRPSLIGAKAFADHRRLPIARPGPVEKRRGLSLADRSRVPAGGPCPRRIAPGSVPSQLPVFRSTLHEKYLRAAFRSG